MDKRDADERNGLGKVIVGLISPFLGAFVFYVTWNQFTDPPHPLRFSYVVVTYYFAALVWWVLIGLMALLK